jgi:hypothetical protein
MNEEQVFDCSGFNFHNPNPPRGYLIFDPQSEEENNRLDTMLGATALWQSAVEKQRNQVSRSGKGVHGPIDLFTEFYPVGWADNDDVIAVIVSGSMGYIEGKLHVNGQWLAVRLPASAEAELKADLEADLKLRHANLETEIRKAGAQP